MPQYSADELTARLVAAIDPQGHVKDMVVVSEVVTMLETMHITAEHLKATRLGKHINTVRRQLSESNKSLAKRMKTLVKSWQQLLQARPSTTNGLPPTPQQTSTPTNPPRASSPLALNTSTRPTNPPRAGSPLALNTSTRPTPPPPAAKNEEPTYSPVKPHDANKLTITSSSPQTVRELFSEGEKVTNGTQSQGVVSDPAKNRRKLLKLLSKVKKPTAQPPSSPGATNNSDVPLTTEPSNQLINTFSNSNFISIDENENSTSNGRDASLKPTPSSVENDDSSSLRVCLPRGAIARTPQTSRKTVHKKHKRLKQEVLDSLSVSLPRNLIRLKSKQIIPTITSSDSLNMEVTTLVVSIPIKHYTKKKNHYSSSSKMSGKKIRDTFLEPTGPVQPVSPANPVQKTLDVIEPPILRMPHKTLNSDNQEAEPMEVDDISHTTEAILDNSTAESKQTSHEDKGPSTELSTYCFTEPVSNSELTSVMLLPYVYIDGVTDEV